MPCPLSRFPRAARPSRLALPALAFLLTASLIGSALAQQSSVYSNSTLIVYNTNVPESLELAQFYAQQRNIPEQHIVALNCPTTEEISRADFEETIAKPLRDTFTGNMWWKIYLSPDGVGMHAVSNRFHIITLMYGMPLKVRDDFDPGTKTDPETREEVPIPKIALATTACSVDSELSILGAFQPNKPGAANNPYHKKNVPFFQARLPQMMLVGRIDGPTPEIAKRLIVDAIAAEETGLWGIAYFDLSKKYPKGDEWISRAMDAYIAEGIPAVLDPYPTRFGTNFPMGDASVYFGWYHPNVDGPFLNSKFHFRQGAVASHLHSFSASTIRSPSKAWVGPLLHKGAAAVLGNVYEPYLDLSHHYDLFSIRLLQGYTFIESNYISLPALSWMNIAVGDPLYRPFEALLDFSDRHYKKDANAEFKAYRLATKRWGDEDPQVLHSKLLDAAEKLGSPLILEAMGLEALRAERNDEAASLFKLAASGYANPEDQLRIGLHQVQLLRNTGNVDGATQILGQLATTHASLPEVEAVNALLTELKPPPPPMPPPPASPAP
jgi:uncharacterized protein (TIGR03790 family)